MWKPILAIISGDEGYAHHGRIRVSIPLFLSTPQEIRIAASEAES